MNKYVTKIAQIEFKSYNPDNYKHSIDDDIKKFMECFQNKNK